MENIANQVTQLLDKLTFLPNTAWRLAFVGTIIIAILFLISLLFTLGSKMKSLTKKLIIANKEIAAEEKIDESNVEFLNDKLKSLPEEVQDGWGKFMEQRTGYPSDYMKEKNVLDDTAYQPKSKAGEMFFRIFGFLVFAATVFFAFICLVDDAANVGLEDFFYDFKLVGGIVFSVVLPILFYIVFEIILGAIYRKQRKHLQLVYKSFQDTIDEKVVIYANEEEEFTSENLEEITHNIEEIIASRLSKEEVVEVITAPKVSENEYVAKKEAVVEKEPEEKAVEPLEEKTPIVPVEEAPLTKEEQASRLSILYDIVDAAIADEDTTVGDLEQIAELIYNNLSKFEEKMDRDVLEGCLYKLSDLDTIIANRNK